jgi:hypothetical protein
LGHARLSTTAIYADVVGRPNSASRLAAVEFQVIIAQPGASAAATNDDALLLLGTTELYLKKTPAAGFRVILSP